MAVHGAQVRLTEVYVVLWADVLPVHVIHGRNHGCDLENFQVV